MRKNNRQNRRLHIRKFRKIPITVLLISFILPLNAYAEFEWVSYTLDNDLFIGNDSGYTNGLSVALYDSEESSGEEGGFAGKDPQPKPSWMLSPLLWSLKDEGYMGAVNIYTIGQSMITPEDIQVEVPSEEDLPYAGLLFINNTFLAINENFADKISTSIGVVGPLSLAEESQKFVHELIGADEPLGWDTQLKNELVFQFSRARAWRSWISDDQSMDLVTSVEASLGTISSSVNVGVMFRYGTDLSRTYATELLNTTRTSNPAAIDGGWYIYTIVNSGYLFNQIFTDGNTFRDSRSIDYRNEFVGISIGLAYSWKDYSLSVAFNDANLISDDSEEQLKNLTEYGTITFAYRF
ncbi:lipid A deacylase LpxR family protein [Aliikangiella coralliicola]|uniref:Lipid A deacylase LpxR family protein n=1 Tax=Aliikangiella coralliicola TaxID=2592383 RepID=A0A545U908_9GAMM|nr:lipid A deacylase LpxR family protein [Aliikangiella coralliicola]TQV85956.1 lipid A deacylase LpxR family protein [Aliikangiella coralliicola]